MGIFEAIDSLPSIVVAVLGGVISIVLVAVVRWAWPWIMGLLLRVYDWLTLRPVLRQVMIFVLGAILFLARTQTGLIGGLSDREIVELVQNRLAEMRVELGPGKMKERDMVHQATSAGIVVATAALGGAGRCIIYGYAAADRGSLNSPRNSRYLLGSSALQYVGGGPGAEDRNSYIPMGSITIPVRKNEFWIITGCKNYGTNIKFYALEFF